MGRTRGEVIRGVAFRVAFELARAGPTRALAREALLRKERWSSGVGANLTAPEVRADPYPLYRRLRSHDPVHWSELTHAWVLTRHTDVEAVLGDWRFSARRTQSTYYRQVIEALGGWGPTVRTMTESLLSVDPPDHSRLRALVNRAFTRGAVEAMRPRVEAVVGELLDAAGAKGRFDAIADFASPLPVIVIAEMLGIPAADQVALKRWSDDVGAVIDPVIDRGVMRRADRAVAALTAYLRPLLRERRERPRADLMSALVAADDAGDRLGEEELYAMCILLLVAGNETTTNLIGNSVLALLRHPQELQRLAR